MGFADEPPTWGHPPDPKVQSKSFKRLQRHLQEHEEDGMCVCMFMQGTFLKCIHVYIPVDEEPLQPPNSQDCFF